MKNLMFARSIHFSATEDTTGAATLDPRFDVKQYEKGGKFETADVLAITQAMMEAPTDELKYKFAKLQLERVKAQFVDPMKDIREKEKADAQKQAEAAAAAVAQFRDRVNGIFTDAVLEDFAEIAADYGEAGHGKILSVEIFAKQGEDGKWKAEFSSNIAKARAKSSGTSRTRESGATGAGVWVEGTGKKMDHPNGKTIEETQTIDKTHYDSFADAARALAYIDDSTVMKGLNCKRLLEGKGFKVGYEEVPAAPATEAATEGAAVKQDVAVVSRRR